MGSAPVQRSSKLDVGIGFLALCGVLLFGHLLKESFSNMAPLRSDQARLVGEMVVLRPGVRVKTLEDYSWYPIGNGSGVFRGDTIFTGGDSQAVLRLAGGRDEIRLEPYSLITLTEREGLAEVTLHFGEFESDLTESALIVNTEGERSLVRAEGASVRLRRESRELNIKVLKGDVQVDRNDQKTVLQQNQVLALADTAAPSLEEEAAFVLETVLEPPRLVRPQTHYKLPADSAIRYNNGLYRVPPSRSLNLNWSQVEQSQAYEVLFAKDEDFKEVLSARRFSEPEANLSLLPQGGFHWKVRAQAPGGGGWSDFSEAGKVEIEVPTFSAQPAPPVFTQVDDTRAIAMQELQPFQGVERFEVEHKKEGDEEWTRRVLQSPELEIPGEKGQTTTWRARPLSAAGLPLGEFSEPFEVTFGEELFAPKVSPEEVARQKLTAQALSRPPVLRGPAQEETFISFGNSPSYVVFDWRAHPSVQEYTIQVARDLDFQTVISEKVVDEPLFVFTETLEPGTYFWRVRSLVEGEPSPWSAAKSVRIASP